ncbi:hypothetical protein HC928_17080, partial [bacterium]|nr:hypothetical protein [bacterium]
MSAPSAARSGLVHPRLAAHPHAALAGAGLPSGPAHAPQKPCYTTPMNRTRHTPYGSPFGATSPTPPTPFAFTGQPRDLNGLQYHRVRYYDPIW